MLKVMFGPAFISLSLSDSGTAGGCAGICALVEHEVHDKLVEAVCNVICDAVGITAFTMLIKEYNTHQLV